MGTGMTSVVLGKDGEDLLPGQPLTLSPRFRPPPAPDTVTVENFLAADLKLEVVCHMAPHAEPVTSDDQLIKSVRVYLASASEPHALSGRRPPPDTVLCSGDFDLDLAVDGTDDHKFNLDVTGTMPGDIKEGNSEMSGELQVAVLSVAKSGAASSEVRWSTPFSWPHAPGLM